MSTREAGPVARSRRPPMTEPLPWEIKRIELWERQEHESRPAFAARHWQARVDAWENHLAAIARKAPGHIRGYSEGCPPSRHPGQTDGQDERGCALSARSRPARLRHDRPRIQPRSLRKRLRGVLRGCTLRKG